MRAFLVVLVWLAGCSGGGAALTQAAGAATPTRVLVMLGDGDDADEIVNEFSGDSITRIGATSFFVLTVPPGTDLNALLHDLDGDARVVMSELDYVGSAPEGGPDEIPVLGSDVLASIRPQPGLVPLRLADAHALSTGGGVVVAVVDTGVDATHPFLAGSLQPGGFDFLDNDDDPTDERDFVDNDNDGVVDEQYGHGTFIASLVLAVAPDARILPVRALDAEGFGTASTIAAGIVWAADAGAQVINVSVDIPTESEAVKEAVSYAEGRGAIIVAAAGNDAALKAVFPARFSDVLAVAAVDASGAPAPFTNTGSDIDLAAPGVDLIGAVPFDLNATGTARWSGTSFAAPLAAGAAALVAARFPGLDARDVMNRLVATAAPLPAGLGGLVQPADALGP